MSAAFALGRAICVVGEALAWPGERLFWLGDHICFRALYGDTPEREAICPACNDEGRVWDCDGWNAWQVACAQCAASVTLTEGGDVKQAPGASLSGAVPKGDAPCR